MLSEKMNEIIFENRNKAYGAYAIRTSYNLTLGKSLLLVTGFFVSLCSLGYYYSHVSDGKDIIPLSPPLDNWIDQQVTFKPLEDYEIQPKQKQSLAGKSAANALSFQITDNDLITEENPQPPSTSDNDLNGSTNGVSGNSATSLSGSGSDSSMVGSPAPAPEPETITLAPDVMPRLKNLNEFIVKNTRYPSAALENSIEGNVYVNFIVDEEGNILNPKVVRGIGMGCDEEALRVVKLLPKWEPGIKNGKKVKVSFNLPFRFAIQH